MEAVDELIDVLSIDDTLLYRALCSQSYIDFVCYMHKNYQVNWHHELIASKLEAFERGEIKKLMICVPPQHGKSQLSTRDFPPFLLGKNPKRKIGVLSYGDTKAQEFNRDIQRIIDSEEYRDIFPDTVLNSVNVSSDSKRGVLRNAHMFEVVGHHGFVKTVGRGGGLTGTSLDICIIDDLYKDREEAKSNAINESIWSWWTDVVSTRFHNGSQVLALNTRWDIKDWNARVLAQEQGWTVINLPAIKENNLNEEDPREIGEALWPEKHSLARMLETQKNNPATFNSLYQQDPKPSKETLVYPDWQVVDFWPKEFDEEFYGQDYGFTNDPSTLIHIRRHGRKLFLKEVFYETGLLNSAIAKRAKLYGIVKEVIIADSAEQKTNESLRKEYGLNVVDSIKGPDSIDAGISKMKEYEVYIHSSATNIVNERNNYQWIMQGGVATNTPVDKFNHAMDAVRGAVFTKSKKVDFKGSFSVM